MGFELSGPRGRMHLTTLMPTEEGVLAVVEEDATGTTAGWAVTAIGICAPLFDTQVDLGWNVSPTSSGTHSTMAVCPTGFDVTSSGGYVHDTSGSTGDLALFSLNPAVYQGIHYGMASSLEVPPRTTADSTLYSYVVCADLR